MDVQPEPAEPDRPPACASSAAGDCGDSRVLLRALGRELEQPVIAMRGEISRILADGADGPGSEGRRESARSLLELCDGLLGMTRAWSSASPGDEEAEAAAGSQSGG